MALVDPEQYSSDCITTFNFNNSELRVVELEGSPWFVAVDVCRVLDLKEHGKGGFGHHLKRALNANEITPISKVGASLSGKGSTHQRIISESGLYKLIMRSDKPQAKPFQDWVTKVVLPAIRKDGGYIAGEENTDDDDLLMARALQVAQRKIESIQQRMLEQFSSSRHSSTYGQRRPLLSERFT